MRSPIWRSRRGCWPSGADSLLSISVSDCLSSAVIVEKDAAEAVGFVGLGFELLRSQSLCLSRSCSNRATLSIARAASEDFVPESSLS